MKIVICGDLSVTECSFEPFYNKDLEKAFSDTVSIYKSADRAIVNLECALTESENAIKKFGPNLKGPSGVADCLVAAGFTDCALSNNHIFDFGKEGLKDTIKELDRCGLNYTGVGENYDDSRRDLVIEHNGFTVSVVNVCEHEYSYATEKRVGARPFDPFDTMADIRKAKAKSDRVIVIYHGGKEYCRYPSPRLLKACRAMVDNGADVVLCQHSHCIGTYENYNGSHILYGQGNFHFPYRLPDASFNEGLIVTLEIDKTKNDIGLIAVKALKNGTLRLATDAESEEIFSEMEERNKHILDGTWRDFWHEYCVEKATHYPKFIAEFTLDSDDRGKQIIAHYLDCEAHTDVCRELFPSWNDTNEL